MSYVIAPYTLVKKEFPEFRELLKTAHDATISRAENIWPGFKFGGLLPGDREFGITTLLPDQVILNKARAPFGSYNWLQSFTAPGSWVDIFSYDVPEDEIHTIVGFAIPDPTLIFSQLRFEIGDKKYPRIDLEEARAYAGEGGIAIILKTDVEKELVIQEETSVRLRGWQEYGTSGIVQRVIPLGIMAYKRKDIVIKE